MIEIDVNVLGLWRWKLYDKKGLLIASSREFKTRKECEDNIRETQFNLNRLYSDDYPEFVSNY